MSASKTRNQATVREARAGDVKRLTELCRHLGYPSTQDEIARRLSAVDSAENNVVFVTENADGAIAGFVQVSVRALIVSNPAAEICALVVDPALRGHGYGKMLMREAESWSRARGVTQISLRSNVIREEAHKFYEGLGYHTYKTQLALRKIL